ncbi:MAG: redox-regulated ATPase YchF, partial [Chloroflexi bacterium]|nr:redox-regulated ATPase YchF [Chloroflexota bacterium]
MEICIIGIPKSGKTTVFNALTRGKSQIAAYAPSALEPNIGVAKVKEPRLQVLETMFKPKKTTLAEIRYVDI